jgi:hypothetical protein
MDAIFAAYAYNGISSSNRVSNADSATMRGKTEAAELNDLEFSILIEKSEKKKDNETSSFERKRNLEESQRSAE